MKSLTEWFILSGLSVLSPVVMAQAGSAEAGQRGFGMCMACHSVDGSAKATGPTLKGIAGRKAASDEGYKSYSAALKGSKITWDDEKLLEYMAAPTKLVPGTTMVINVPGEAQRKDLLAYLKSLK